MPLPPRLAASAAAATTVPAESSAAPESTLGLRPRLVHRQTASTQLVAVELVRCLLRFFVSCHFDERKAARAAGSRIAHHAHGFHGAGAAKQLLQLRFARRVRQIADVKPSTHY